ncbi:proline--tRNA ligase [Bordetella pertussis]|nr:proline--tRNA ligase [Bordetella pertussis]
MVICPVGWGKSETVRDTALALYEALRARGVDVMLDDRDSRPGVMFAEWELIGVPLRVTVGERGLNEGVVELQARREAEAAKVPVDQALAQTLAKLDLL